MNLATRCTECGTVFRVVPDQLKVSEGWVRCGRCSAVFNAQEQLFDLDAPAAAVEAPAPTTVSTAQGAISSAADDAGPGADVNEAQAVPTGDGEPAIAAFDDARVDAFDSTPRIADTADPVEGPAGPVDDRAAPDPTAPADPPDTSPAVVVSIGEAGATTAAAPVRIDDDEASPTPSFMQASNDALFWHRPGVRGLLVGLAAVLALALAVQSVLIWRDALAAQFTAMRPALQAICDGLGCRISPLRRIESLSVDASGLTRIEGAPLHRLSVTLRNRADIALLAPALELSLTDVQGKMLARRVLTLAELGAAATTLAPGAELPLQALLSTGERRIAGYTVELFYP